jgi:NADH:ubiquinone oxidoreductase subunit D
LADKRRLNLSFSMASPFQREAWKRLCAIPSGQRTDAVCRAVCRMYEQDTLLEAVRQIIREELRGVELISAKEKAEQPQAGDVDDNVLGFLLALQNDGGDE